MLIKILIVAPGCCSNMEQLQAGKKNPRGGINVGRFTTIISRPYLSQQLPSAAVTVSRHHQGADQVLPVRSELSSQIYNYLSGLDSSWIPFCVLSHARTIS